MADDDFNHKSQRIFPDVDFLASEPRLATRLDESRRRLLARQASAPGAAWVADRLAALDAAVESLRKARHRFGAIEAAWIAVDRVREMLCLHADRPALIEIALDVQNDFTEHVATPPAHTTDMKALVDELVHGEGEPTPLQRNVLHSLAIVAARRRESDWHRANHLVVRRSRAAISVGVILAILVVVLPFGFEHVSVGEGILRFGYSWAREAGCILAVLACGALGGLLSVLLGQERLQISPVEHHILVGTHRLRPIIGAASALVFFMVWESGLLQVADAGERRPGQLSSALLLVCVVAGFSERLLVGQIEKLSTALQGRPEPAYEVPRPVPPPAEMRPANGAQAAALTEAVTTRETAVVKETAVIKQAVSAKRAAASREPDPVAVSVATVDD